MATQFPVGIDQNGDVIREDFAISGTDNRAQARLTAATNEFNYAMARQANAWNIEQWERENEYNSPANMRQLYEQAGLNPLAFMSGLDSSAQHLESAQANAVAPNLNTQASFQKAMALMQGLNTLSGQYTQMKQNKLLDAQTAESQARAEQTKANTGYIGQMTSYQSKVNSWYDILQEVGLNRTEAETYTLQAQKQHYIALIDQSEQATKQLKEATEVARQQGLLLSKQNESYWRMFNKQMDLVESQVKSNFAAAGLSDAQATQVAKITREYYSSMTEIGSNTMTMYDWQLGIARTNYEGGNLRNNILQTELNNLPAQQRAALINSYMQSYNLFVDGTTTAVQSYMTGGLMKTGSDVTTVHAGPNGESYTQTTTTPTRP